MSVPVSVVLSVVFSCVAACLLIYGDHIKARLVERFALHLFRLAFSAPDKQAARMRLLKYDAIVLAIAVLLSILTIGFVVGAAVMVYITAHRCGLVGG